jgi:hypothetical protein
MRNLSPEEHALRGKKHSVSLKQYWAGLSPDERAAHALKTKQGQTKEGRLRQRIAIGGRRRSQEVRAKISVAKTKYWKKRNQENTNHVIVGIKEGPTTDVFDFTVPGAHTAVIGTGVVTHNCNTHAYLRINRGPVDHTGDHTEDVLDFTVCSRSHDVIWGLYGANAVHFSVLQEYLAARLDVGVGTMTTLSNNYHLYESALGQLAGRAGAPPGHSQFLLALADERYSDGTCSPMPLVHDAESFDAELRLLLIAYELYDTLSGRGAAEAIERMQTLNNKFLGMTVWPALMAHRNRRGRWHGWARMIQATDWRLACTEWLERRELKRAEVPETRTA